jgi:DNA helicase II / ATP-dependent DNA helicase PcrA
MATLLDSLNSPQQEAVKEIETPLLIIAGAGSGKTLTVASKVAYLIEKGTKPENILALAFNQKAAEELKERGSVLSTIRRTLTFPPFTRFVTRLSKITY